MSLPVESLSGAEVETQDVYRRLEDWQEGLGDEFEAVVGTYPARIAVFPEIAPIYDGRVRRQIMRRFPYGIFYEYYPARILIAALLDLRQDQSQILRRLQR